MKLNYERLLELYRNNFEEVAKYDDVYSKIYKEIAELLDSTVEEIQGFEKGKDALLIAKVLERAFGEFTMEQLLIVSAMVMRYVELAQRYWYNVGYSEGFQDGQVMSILLQTVGRFGQ